MLKIYHNPKCRKSREGLEYLRSKGIEFEVVLYLEKPLSPQELKTILMKLNLNPLQVLRTQEEMYRRELKGKNFTREEWLNIISQNPRLLQRPIVEGRYKAVIAIPASRIKELQ